jgi:predicted molibdopterin-dependent oxidoreductase YjgC
MARKIRFSLNGLEIITNEGATILEAALENDVYIPHLCHHPDLVPVGVCRLCGVEVDGRGLVMSCVTPVTSEMVVTTDTERVSNQRMGSLELLIANHHGECLSCTKNESCELLKVAAFVGIDEGRVAKLRKPEELMPVDSSNPFFTFDPNKCVLCGICVRTCDESQGRQAIDFIHRGYDTKIGTAGDVPFIESICESCGECVVRCPVGSLTIKDYKKPSYEVSTVCSYCGVGCGINLGIQGDRIVNVSGNREAPANEGALCVKGRFGSTFVDHPDRLIKPMVREYLLNGGKRKKKTDRGEWVEVEWDTALDLVAEKLVAIKKKSGSDAVGFLSSAKCTNEENYLMQKFARQVIGTHSIDHCARL